MGKSILILIGCLAVAGFIAFGAWISLKNQIVAMEENVNGQWAQIDNQLKRRNDLIPNFVATVKGYAAHEMKAIETITAAREKLAGGNLSQADRMKAEGEVGAAISRLLVISESNPELKANANFRALADELAGTENRIAVARKDYNDAVRMFNTKIKQWPGSTLGYESKPYFEVPEADKTAPKVEF
ncbi:MAG: LemA family protein [Victivallales bacterium]|nr:LemA family protein [Victivallales bacterium]MBR6323910.1 LemA family protein [Victivallales bacterium]